MTKYRRKILAVRGDTQGGHAGGLVNPDTLIPEMDIDENGKEVIAGWRHPEMRPVQKRLWAWHIKDLSNVRTLAGKDEIIFLEMGDLTQGSVFKDDLAETSLSAQVILSQWLCKPWMDLPNVQKMRIVKGTGVHVWGEGSTETILTHLLQKEYPKKSVAINDHYMLSVDGFRVDVAHHGSGPGIRNWTRGNAFELYVKSVMRDAIDMGEEPPSMILRAHRHEFIYRRAIHQTRENVWEMPAFITPPYCFIGSHAQKVMNSPASMGVGVLAFEILNGKLYDWHRFTHYVDLRTREAV